MRKGYGEGPGFDQGPLSSGYQQGTLFRHVAPAKPDAVRFARKNASAQRWAGLHVDYEGAPEAYNENIQPLQFFHASDHEFTPGDWVEPGHPSNFPEVAASMHAELDDPDDPYHEQIDEERNKVWVGTNPKSVSHFGKNVYQVEHLGPDYAMEHDEESHPEDFKSPKQMYYAGKRRSPEPFQVIRKL